MINNNIVDRIKQLTKDDKKNLSQKALKVCEEAGELAKVVLPYDNAHSTTHRFIAKEQILEEVVDTFLTSISIAYSLGFSDSEIEKQIASKLSKWAMLQNQGKEVGSDPIPYEIHITVKDADKQLFIETCKRLAVKPIILDLQSKDGDVKFHDIMTSSVFFGNNKAVYDEMNRISNGLSEVGINVIRKKIETVPWHPAAPQEQNMPMPTNCYFESHINVISDDSRREQLEAICALYGAHLSRNVFKMRDDNTYTVMVTYRVYDGIRQGFELVLEDIKLALTTNGFDYEKVTTEFSIFDTKLSHDSSWLTL